MTPPRPTTPQLLALAGATLLALTPELAQAYSGPGVGLGAIGVVFGIIGSVLLMTLSLIWYPVKRLIRAIRGTPKRVTPKARGTSATH